MKTHRRRVRVLLADDHQLILDGVRHALEEAADEFEIVGEATKGSHVLPLVKRTQPHLVMLDLRMPEVDGLVCLDQIKKRYPEIKVIVLSVSSDRALIDNVLKRGASAYIVKSVNPVDLPAVIRQAVEETVYTAVGLPDDPSSRAAKAAGLTERELAILTALARGMSNAAIAKQLWVAQQTVKFHLTNIYRKLGVANRTEAARYAYQQGLIESPLHEDDDEGEAAAGVREPRRPIKPQRGSGVALKPPNPDEPESRGPRPLGPGPNAAV